MGSEMKKQRKSEPKVPIPPGIKKRVKIELIFLVITILFSLFGFILISYDGNVGNMITGFASFEIFPKEDFIPSIVEENETFFVPVIEEEIIQTQDFSVMAVPTQNTPYKGVHILPNTDHDTLDDNLVGYWTFEVNADDKTGVNNGTLINGSTQTHEGRVGKAYSFDGNDDYIEIPDDNSLDMDEYEPWTVSAWIYLNGTNTYNTLFLKHRTSTYINYVVWLQSTGATFGNHYTAAGITTPIAVDEWVHIVAVYNGTGTTSNDTTNINRHLLYLNGTYIGSACVANKAGGNCSSGIAGTGKAYIGINGAQGFAHPFNGTIDEVMVWNRTLNSTEIVDLYNISKGIHKVKSIYDLSVSPNNASDSDNDKISYIYDWYVNNVSFAVLNMPFDTNNSGGVNITRDYSLYMNNGTLGNITEGTHPTFNSTGGYDDHGAYEFDGSQFIEIAYDDSLNFSQNNSELTISAWVKYHNTGCSSDVGLIFAKMQSSYVYYNYAYWILCKQNSTQFGNKYTATGTATNTLEPDKWQHVAVTWNSTNAFFYVNGINTNNGLLPQCAGCPGGLGPTGTGKAYIGGDPPALGVKYLNGTIDQVMVFNRSLSSAQILALYQNRTNTIVNEETKKNELWHAQIWISDGQNDSVPLNTTVINISSNVKPEVTSITIYPSLPNTDSILQCNATVYDIDKVDTMDVNITWYNGTAAYSSFKHTGVNNSQIINYTLPEGVQAKNETWNCTTFANDGTDDSALNSTTKIIVGGECGSIPVEDCTISKTTTFNTNNYYLNLTSSDTILNINVSNIIINCNGSKFIGNNDSYSYYFFNISDYSNITIKGCYIENYGYGIYTKLSQNNTFLNNTINDTYYDQIKLINSSYNIIENNTLYGYTVIPSSGIYLTNHSNYNNITNNTIYENYYGLFLKNSSSNKIVKNNISNIASYGVYNLDNTLNVFSNNTITETDSYVIYDRSTIKSNYTHNKLKGKNGVARTAAYFTNSNDTYIHNNTHQGANIIFATNIAIQGSCNNIIISNNTVSLTQYGISVAGKNVTLTGNIIKEQSQGMAIYGDNIRIYNNTFTNITKNFDQYDIGIKIPGGSNVYIQGNNFSDLGDTGIHIQTAKNITIKNNTFDFLSLNARANGGYSARDYYEAEVAISVTEIYKTWLTLGQEIGSEDTISYVGNFSSDNITIANNSFGPNVQVKLRLQGTTNLTHDITDYWYRAFQAPAYLLDKDEFYISNNFNNLSNINGTWDISNKLRQGYRGSYKIRYQIFSNFMNFKNINDTTTYTVRLYNLSLATPYDDVYDITNEKILSCNNDQYNATLSPGQEINVSDYTSLCPVAVGVGGISRGGAGKVTPVLNLDKDLFHILIKQGETFRETLTIKNIGGTYLDIRIDTQELSKFLIVSEKSFTLAPGETKTINVDFFVKEKEIPEVYTGRILVYGDGIVKVINTIIEVKAKEPIFDLKVDTLTKEVNLNDYIKSKISVLNLGDLKGIDILLHYSIKDFEGNVYDYKEESLKIDENLELIRSLKVPGELGKYIFYVKADYKGIIATSSDTFDVIKEKESNVYELILLSAITSIMIILKIFKYKFLKKKRRKK